MGTSNKLIKYVYGSSPELEQLLKNYRTQRNGIEENIQQLV